MCEFNFSIIKISNILGFYLTAFSLNLIALLRQNGLRVFLAKFQNKHFNAQIKLFMIILCNAEKWIFFFSFEISILNFHVLIRMKRRIFSRHIFDLRSNSFANVSNRLIIIYFPIIMYSLNVCVHIFSFSSFDPTLHLWISNSERWNLNSFHKLINLLIIDTFLFYWFVWTTKYEM